MNSKKFIAALMLSFTILTTCGGEICSFSTEPAYAAKKVKKKSKSAATKKTHKNKS